MPYCRLDHHSSDSVADRNDYGRVWVPLLKEGIGWLIAFVLLEVRQ